MVDEKPVSFNNIVSNPSVPRLSKDFSFEISVNLMISNTIKGNLSINSCLNEFLNNQEGFGRHRF